MGLSNCAERKDVEQLREKTNTAVHFWRYSTEIFGVKWQRASAVTDRKARGKASFSLGHWKFEVLICLSSSTQYGWRHCWKSKWIIPVVTELKQGSWTVAKPVKAGDGYLSVSIYEKDIYNHSVFTFPLPLWFGMLFSCQGAIPCRSLSLVNLSFTSNTGKREWGFSLKTISFTYF